MSSPAFRPLTTPEYRQLDLNQRVAHLEQLKRAMENAIELTKVEIERSNVILRNQAPGQGVKQ